jgi:BlaI family penicillinase repressor
MTQIKISPAEWEVLNVLWDKAPATSQDVSQALAGDQDWHPKTVNTFLTRLASKGIVEVQREGKLNIYQPLKTREQCVRAESESFLQRVFRGSVAPMMAHFVENTELSEAEIAELQRMLKARARKGSRP